MQSTYVGTRRTERERVHIIFRYDERACEACLARPRLKVSQVNRNKKSLGLSFQHASGVEILHKLAAEADILVENYLPNALAKYRMDYTTLAAINPKLIYASITGYGQTGPYSNRAGYDVMVEAYVFSRRKRNRERTDIRNQ